MPLADWLTPFRDRAWQRRHIWQHLAGGVAWYLLLLGVPPTRDLTPWERVYWVAFIQGVWERYQREYEPTYPYWSMVADWALTVAAATLLAVTLS